MERVDIADAPKNRKIVSLAVSEGEANVGSMMFERQ